VKIVRASAAPRSDLLPTADDIASARRALDEANIERVVLLRRPNVTFAVESLRPEGSFKIRGAVAALAKRRGNVVAASAGNHGIGVASAAKRLGLPATVVVPKTARRKKVDVIRALGCELLEEGEGYEAAEAVAMKLAKERGVPFLSPYDDVDVVAGNGATLGLEILEGLATKPRSVVAPIGGGGLATGLACVLGPSRIVWGAQSEASPAFAMSLERGAAVTTLPYAKTLADGIEGGIAASAFARAAGTLAGALVVSEDAIANAMKWAARELGLVIEGSAAAALAPLLEGFEADVVVLTGRNV
jgi:threonine dehydratase